MTSAAVYKLRCSLLGHSMDVRCVAVTEEGSIVTGSRDRTAKIWKPKNAVEYVEFNRLCGHTNFVSCVCVIPPDDAYPAGLILTGSNDKTICAFIPEVSNPIYRLTGHTNTVCALTAGKYGTVISGSWDQTARVWLGEKCMTTLQGHAGTIWSVAVINEFGIVLTASADKTIKSWKTGQCQKTFTGHTDCVRALAVVSAEEFLSAANDGTIRRWHIAGEPISCFQAHDSFIYSLALMPEGCGGFISTSEDRLLKVWKTDGECRQTICLPAQSIWAGAVLPNGDIVVGSSDAVARIFTCVNERQASVEELKAFEEEVAGTGLSTGMLGDFKISELPGKESLYEPGKRDGQTKLVRDGSKVGVYQWSAAETRWLKIGDAMGSAGMQTPGSKIQFEGKEYDYVFDVDIEDGRPPLKLPYNATEDPWFAAQKFLERNDISQMFLDQVANFIVKNSQGMTLGPEQPAQNSDPFTGQSRYLPTSGTFTGSSSSSGTDPFTGAGRYVPSSDDPVKKPVAPFNEYFPQRTILTFDSGNLKAIEGKLREFLKLGRIDVNDNEVEEVIRLASDSESQSGLSALGALEKLLHSPTDSVFPVLDILRLAIRKPRVCKYFCNGNAATEFLQILLGLLSLGSPPANQMLALRALCNMMSHLEGEQFVMEKLDDILSASLQVLPTQNRNVEVAVATLILNLAVVLYAHKNTEKKVQSLSGMSGIMNTVHDPEAQFRLLVAIGTFAADDNESALLVKSMDLLPFVQRLKNVNDPPKIALCATNVEFLLA